MKDYVYAKSTEGQRIPFHMSGAFWITIVVCFATAYAKLLNTLQETIVYVGDSTNFSCRSNISSAIHWDFNDNAMYAAGAFYNKYKDRFTMDINQTTGTYTLHIKNITFGDSGEYMCREDEGRGESSSANLNVSAPAAFSTSNLQSTSTPPANIGSTSGTTCHLWWMIVLMILLIVIAFMVGLRLQKSYPGLPLALCRHAEDDREETAPDEDGSGDAPLSDARCMKLQQIPQEHFMTLGAWSDDLLHILHVTQAINGKQLDEIRAEKHSYDGMSMLIRVIMKSNNRSYNLFILALIATWKQDVASFLEKGTKHNIEIRIVRHFHFLAERIDCDFGLLDKLLSKGSLTTSEIRTIKAEKTDFNRNRALLNCVLEKHLTKSFMEVLRETRQGHLVSYLCTNGARDMESDGVWPLTEKEFIIIQSNHEALVDRLETSELLGYLYSVNVINRQQRDLIDSKATQQEKNTTFLNILRKMNLKDFRATFSCLNATKQSHIAELLATKARRNGDAVACRGSMMPGTNFII